MLSVTPVSAALPVSQETYPAVQTYAPEALIYAEAPQSPTAEVSSTTEESSTDEITALLQEEFQGLWPEMRAIALCESGLQQFGTDGKPVRSETADTGLMQINDIWLTSVNRLGYDINTTEGNIKMAGYVFSQQGFRAWSCARILGIVQ